MLRTHAWAALLALLALLAACSDAVAPTAGIPVSAAPSDLPMGATGIVGRALDWGTDEPVAGATIWTEPPTGRVRTTDAGEFALLDGVVGGTFYRVHATAEGYRETSAVVVGEAEQLRAAELFLVRADQPPTARPAEATAVFHPDRHRIEHPIVNLGDRPAPWTLTAPDDASWLRVLTPEGILEPHSRGAVALALEPGEVRRRVEEAAAPQTLTTTLTLRGGQQRPWTFNVIAEIAAAEEVALSVEGPPITEVGGAASLSWRATVGGAPLQHAAVALRVRASESELGYRRELLTDHTGRLQTPLSLLDFAAVEVVGEVVAYGAQDTWSLRVEDEEPPELPARVELSAALEAATPALVGAPVVLVVTARRVLDDGTAGDVAASVPLRLGWTANGVDLPEQRATTDASGLARFELIPAAAGRYLFQIDVDSAEFTADPAFAELDVIASAARVDVDWNTEAPLVGVDRALIASVHAELEGVDLAGSAVVLRACDSAVVSFLDAQGNVEIGIQCDYVGPALVTLEVTQIGTGALLHREERIFTFVCPPGALCDADCTLGVSDANPLEQGWCLADARTAAPSIAGVVPITWRVASADALPVDLVAEIRSAGTPDPRFPCNGRATQARADAAQRQTTQGTLGLPSTPGGVEYTFLWDSQHDCGNYNVADLSIALRLSRGRWRSRPFTLSGLQLRNGIVFDLDGAALALPAIPGHVASAPADFDRDGDLDLATSKVIINVADNEPHATLYMNEGSALGAEVFDAPVVRSPFTRVDRVATADLLDLDLQELVVAGLCDTGGQEVLCMEWFAQTYDAASMQTTGLLSHAAIGGLPLNLGGTFDLAVGDVNGDSLKDIIYVLQQDPPSEVHWSLGDPASGPGFFVASQGFVFADDPGAPLSLHLLRLGRPGAALSIVTRHVDPTRITTIHDPSNAASVAALTAPAGVADLASADFNDDGIEELVYNNGAEIVTARWEPAALRWQGIAATPLPPMLGEVRSILTGDVNQDGVEDVVVLGVGGIAGLTGRHSGELDLQYVDGADLSDLTEAWLGRFDDTGSQLDLLLRRGMAFWIAPGDRPAPALLRPPLPSRQVFSSGGRSQLVDADRDGRLDLVTDPGVSSLNVYPGRGDGTFEELPTRLPIVEGATTFTGIATVLQGDAESPLLLTSSDNGGVAWCRVEGSACVPAGVAPALSPFAAYLGSWDIDEDGAPDPAFIDQAGAITVARSNNGAPDFLTTPQAALPGVPRQLAALPAGHPSGALLVLTDDALTSLTLAVDAFTPNTSIPLPDGLTGASLAVARFDADALEDLVVFATDSGGASNLVAFSATANGFSAPTVQPLPGRYTALHVQDLDRDGRGDALLIMGSDDFHVSFSEASGRGPALTLPGHSVQIRSLPGDVDGDGIADGSFFGGGTATVFRSTAGLTRKLLDAPPEPSALTIIRGEDGRPRFVVGSALPGANLHTVEPSGAQQELPHAVDGAIALHTTSRNGDGLDDLLVLGTAETFELQSNNGGFTRVEVQGAPLATISAHDFHRDGIDELVALEGSSVEIYQDSTPESLDLLLELPVSSAPGRFTWRQGRDRIVATNRPAQQTNLHVLSLSDPQGQPRVVAQNQNLTAMLAPFGLITSITAVQIIPQTAELEIVANMSSGAVLTFTRSLDNGRAVRPWSSIDELFAESILAADANGDGLEDLLLLGFQERTLAIAIGDGEGGFKAPEPFLLPSHTANILVTDLDQDGRRELWTADGEGAAGRLIQIQLSR